MLLVIDNYDSFTYNLAQYLGELGAEVQVYRNDRITLDEIAAARPKRIVVSPGPGTPDNAGITLAMIQRFHQQIPILGVCLGHQAIGQAFGGRVISAPTLVHGKTSAIWHDGRTIFAEVERPFDATRYHSLMIDPSHFPEALEISATTEDGLIMAVRHKQFPTEGVQFHPESILTPEGKKILRNFLYLMS